MSEEAIKFDQDKIPYHLIDPLLLSEVAEVLAYGEKKYAAWNWAKGTFEWHRLYRAAMGHMLDWYMGEDIDPESGRPHLAHAVCDLMFLIRYQCNNWGVDTRPSVLREFKAQRRIGLPERSTTDTHVGVNIGE